MRIEFIGTGSFFNSKDFNTSVFIEDDGTNLLIDCGTTVNNALKAKGLDFEKVQNIAITHIHADHVGGLEEVAFKSKFIYKLKKTLFIPEELKATLWENSLKGGLYDEEEEFVSLESYFNLGRVTDNWFRINGQKYKFIKVDHVKGKDCFGIWCPGKFFYSGDSKFNYDRIVNFASNVKVVFHDCQTFDGGVHASINELLELPKYVKRKIVLMHYSEDIAAWMPIIKENFMGIAKTNEIYEV